jgi:hypothetical protein
MQATGRLSPINTTLFTSQAPNALRAFHKDVLLWARKTIRRLLADYLTGEKRMFLGLGIILLLLWLGGFFVFHVTAFAIHVLLILAVVSLIFHFMRGAASAV